MGTYRSIFPVDSDVYTKGSVSSTEQKVIDAKGFIVEPIDTITWSSLGLSVSTSPAYGITYVDANSAAGDPSTSVALLTIAAPIAGVRKTVIFDTTAAYINTLDLELSGATIVGTSGDGYVHFSSLATATQAITLIGITTALWAVASVNSTVLFYGAATGIRGATVATSS